MDPKKLREERAKLVKRMRELSDAINGDEKRDFTAEEQAEWEKLNGDYDALTRQIERAERLAQFDADERAGNNPDGRAGRDPVNNGDGADDPPADRRTSEPTAEDRALAFAGWCRLRMDLDPSAEQQAAAQRIGFRLDRKQLTVNLLPTPDIQRMQQAMAGVHPSLARRALGTVDVGTGGALVPEGFVPRLERAMLAFGGMLQVAEVIRTDGGGDLPWPTANDTGNTGRRVAESGPIATSGKDPSFAQQVLHAYKYTSDAVLVPYELLEDSAFDLAGVLADMLGERLGRILNTECTTGTGDAQPYGIIEASTLGVTAASATAIDPDELIQLIHSVDPAYRMNARFMLHDSVILYLRQLKDGEGRYLWQSGLQAGVPDTLLGYPITVNQDMASSVAASAKTVVFGQLGAYKIREVRGMRMYRLEERYRDYDQDGFVAFIRRDGTLIDAGTHPVKHLQQHA